MMASAINRTSVWVRAGWSGSGGSSAGTAPRSSSRCLTFTSRGWVWTHFREDSFVTLGGRRRRGEVADQRGEAAQRTQADRGLRRQLDDGGRGRQHPGGNHQGLPRRIED